MKIRIIKIILTILIIIAISWLIKSINVDTMNPGNSDLIKKDNNTIKVDQDTMLNYTIIGSYDIDLFSFEQALAAGFIKIDTISDSKIKISRYQYDSLNKVALKIRKEQIEKYNKLDSILKAKDYERLNN